MTARAMTPKSSKTEKRTSTVDAGSERRNCLAKLAEALGFMRCERLGKEVWYDPTGGHVSWEELPAVIENDITELIAECKDTPLRADDAAALDKLGNPFYSPNR